MNNLTIITVVENDCGTLDLMIRSVLKFTDFVPNFIICCNNKEEYTNISFYYKSVDNIKVVYNKTDLLGGSFRHGSGLNAIFKMVNTRYTAIIESDCVVLSVDWHKIDNNYKMMAALKKDNLYHICFLVFETKYLDGIDFSPGIKHEQAAIIIKAHGFKREDIDVGWRIRKFIDKQDVKLLDFVDCKTGEGNYFDSTFQSDEIHRGGKTLVAHLGRGSNLNSKAVRKGFDSPQKQFERWKDKVSKLIE